MKATKEVSLRKIRWKFRLLGFFKIPIIGYVRPRIIKINAEEVQVSIALRRRTRNHLNSMYFGALAVGADVASGIHVFYLSDMFNKNVSFAFKSVQGNFLKRAESRVTFVCDEGKKVQSLMEKSIETGERINDLVHVKAYNEAGEEVALFTMGISIRVKS